MNIIFKDEQLFKTLQEQTLVKIEFGSSLYGLQTAQSDSDILYIIADSKDFEKSLIWEHHQLQYKENNVDHIFTTVSQFVRNLLTGDSTINFEVLHSQELKNSCLDFLYNQREKFYNYQMTKSYLGLARRDLKQTQENNFINYKKLSHAYRGYLAAISILNKSYDNQYSNYQAEFSEIKSLKLHNTHSNVKELMCKLSAQIDEARNQLNIDFNNHKLVRIMNTHQLISLDNDLINFYKNHEYIKKSLVNADYRALFFEVLEEGLKY